MRAAHIPDGELTAEDVPADDASVADLVRFAHRYHAYKTAGSLQRVAAIAVATHDEWVEQHGADPDAVLRAPVGRMRVALFHTARAYEHIAPAAGSGRHDDDEDQPGGEDETAAWIRVLVRSIAAGMRADGPR